MFVERFRDIVHFKSGADVLQIGRFGNPPSIDDLAALTIDRADFNGRDCRVGDCDVRLPAASIQRFQKEINWAAPDAASRGAALFKQMIVDDVGAYLAGAPERFTQYDDDKRPIRPVDEFNGLLKNFIAIGSLAPELPGYLERFPASPLTGGEDFLYWSKEKVAGMPFITVTHVTIAPAPAVRSSSRRKTCTPADTSIRRSASPSRATRWGRPARSIWSTRTARARPR